MASVKKWGPLLALAWATVALTLVGVEAKPGAQLVVLGLFLAVGGLRGISRNQPWRRYPVAGLIVLAFLAASLISFIQLGLWLFPPVTPEGRPVMPMGQTVGGVVVGGLFCGLLCWLYFARLEPDPRSEVAWVYATLVVLAVAFTVDYVV